MRKLICKWGLIIAITLSAKMHPCLAQSGTTPHKLLLKPETVQVAPNVSQWLDNTSLKSAATEPLQVIVTFSGPVNAEQKQLLASQGILLQDYLPDNSYFAIIAGTPEKAKLSGIPIWGVTVVKASWKADEYLWKKVSSKKTIDVLAAFYSIADSSQIVEYIRSLGGHVFPSTLARHSYYNISIPGEKLQQLASWYATKYISPLSEPVLLDKQSVPAVKGNQAIAGEPWNGYNLHGDSVTIGVGDNTSGIFHIDTRDRILNYNPAAMTNHGIHINGIAGGAAILDPLAEGMTPNVQLLNFFFSNVLSATGAMFHDHNMTVTNNSYTVMEGDCDYFGTYDLYSSYLDTLEIQYPLVQHVFAAGNDGKMSCPPHYPGYGTMGGGYQPSKNAVIVGSVSHNLEQASDQSRGPVRDGRLKPDVVAVGANVYSGISNNNYEWAGGTSMASPQVASGLAILTQQYKRLNSGAQPRADLLKTILMNSAMDLGTEGPDYSYGYGMMDINRSLKALDDHLYDTGTVTNGSVSSITVNVPTGTARARFMLYWNDVPASPSSAKQLVNDLDLTITAPGGATHHPLILNSNIANEKDPATEGADHLNNAEQVTIMAPAAGTYTLSVQGTNVPSGSQHYVTAYDYSPEAIELTGPLGGEQLPNSDSVRIFWNHIPDGNTLAVDFSLDEGTNWIPVATALAPSTHYVSFMPTNINSGRCMVRVRRNGTSQVSTSQRFAINQQPAVTLSNSQCPGYVNIHWSPVPNAGGYEVMQKVGAHMQVIDTVSDTTYSYGNMPLSEASYVAVRPILHGISGYRSLATIRIAKDGDCLLPTSNGDLLAEKILGPVSGRRYTSSALPASSELEVQVRNLYNTTCSNYVLSYTINGSPWQTLVSPGITIPPNGSVAIPVPGLTFATPGNYDIAVAITNTDLTDPQHGNDTLRYRITSLDNPLIDLTSTLTDDFETTGIISTSNDTMGIGNALRWDYTNENDSGHLRTYVYDEVTIGGTRSVSMDQVMPGNSGGHNAFTGTFNLNTYPAATNEIRVDFDYVVHGNPRLTEGNGVLARGADTSPWKTLFSFDFSDYPGTVKHARSLSLSDIMLKSGQDFSTSTQVSFHQNDTTVIAGRDYGSGITIDNFMMYTVSNDAAMAAIVSPAPGNCGLPSSVPLVIKVKNGVNVPLNNISVYYQLDGGSIYSGTITSLGPKDSTNYTFADVMNISSGERHTVNVWLACTGDSYSQNDSMLNYEFLNSRIITDYPYLEDFEGGEGGYYAGGHFSSWAYGTPSSALISKAASGTKAWKTNLTGRYNNLEQSYLYTPCFDISELINPTLSFSMAEDVENCGNTLCDGAYAEYSFDGLSWNKLGQSGDGINWYDSTFNIWNQLSFTRWHVATVPLPHPPAGASLHLRFVLFADPAVTFEGLAIDDIHIYDLQNPILHTTPVKITSEALNPGVWNDFLWSGQAVAAVQPATLSGEPVIALYKHDTISNPSATQYIFSRNYTIDAGLQAGSSVAVRLYLEEEDLVNALADTQCPSCSRPEDAYSLGVTQYMNEGARETENGKLLDDTGANFTYYPANTIKWVPYDKGYRAELTVAARSELWFNDGGAGGDFGLNTDYLNFVAFASGDDATAQWYSLIDTQVTRYILQRSGDGIAFSTIDSISAQQLASASYNYDDPSIFNTYDTAYYRLAWTMTNSANSYTSPVRRVTRNDTRDQQIQFYARTAGGYMVLADWTSYLDGMVDHYTLERNVGSGQFSTIDSRAALNRYGQYYAYRDMTPGVGAGTKLHYRLTATLRTGEQLTLPEKEVTWVGPNALGELYPNPSHDGSFTASWYADPGTAMHVEIFDITGRLMNNTDVYALDWENTTTFETTQALPSGVYVIKFRISNNKYTRKLVIQ